MYIMHCVAKILKPPYQSHTNIIDISILLQYLCLYIAGYVDSDHQRIPGHSTRNQICPWMSCYHECYLIPILLCKLCKRLCITVNKIEEIIEGLLYVIAAIQTVISEQLSFAG